MYSTFERDVMEEGIWPKRCGLFLRKYVNQWISCLITIEWIKSFNIHKITRSVARKKLFWVVSTNIATAVRGECLQTILWNLLLSIFDYGTQICQQQSQNMYFASLWPIDQNPPTLVYIDAQIVCIQYNCSWIRKCILRTIRFWTTNAKTKM